MAAIALRPQCVKSDRQILINNVYLNIIGKFSPYLAKAQSSYPYKLETVTLVVAALAPCFTFINTPDTGKRVIVSTWSIWKNYRKCKRECILMFNPTTTTTPTTSTTP